MAFTTNKGEVKCALATENQVSSKCQTYRTRIVAHARQTNIDEKQMTQVISEMVSTEIANQF